MTKKPLNIGLVGYGFMGRTHSNAFLQAPRYFDLPYKPVLKAVAARNKDRVQAFASTGVTSRRRPTGAPSLTAATSMSSTSRARTTRTQRLRSRPRARERW